MRRGWQRPGSRAKPVAAARRWSTRATAPTSTRRRRSWTVLRSHGNGRRRSGAPPARPPVMGGLHVAIVGDIRNSGVARSDALAFSALGATVTLVAPPTLLPTSVAGWPVEVSPDMGAVLAKCDVAYLVGLQDKQANEWLGPSEREYTATYGLTAERARLLNPSAMVMHPGPVRRGIEVADEVIEGPASVVRAQVAHGVAVCMAILYLLLGSGAAIGA